MSTLHSRVTKLEKHGQPCVLGRWIVLGGDPSPSDSQVSDFLSAQGITRQASDMVFTGEDKPPAAPGTPLTLIGVIPITQTIEEMLEELD